MSGDGSATREGTDDGGEGRRHCVRAARACVVLAALATALVISAPASAFLHRGHVLGATIGSSGTGGGQLHAPAGVAVNEESGDVYVVDRGNDRVQRFSSSGSFISLWGWGVVTGAKVNEICEAGKEPVGGCKPGIPPSKGGEHHNEQLVAPQGIAIDNSPSSPSKGDVYVVGTVRPEKSYLYKYDSQGHYLARVTSPAETKSEGRIEGVSVDAQGHVWVAWSSRLLAEFSNEVANKRLSAEGVTAGVEPLRPGIAADAENGIYVTTEPSEAFVEGEGQEGKGVNGEEPCELSTCVVSKLTTVELAEVGLFPGEPLIPAFDSGHITGIAVDLGGGDVYVTDGGTAAALTSTGTVIQRFGEGTIKRTGGVAVNSKTNTLFIADSGADTVRVAPPMPPGKPLVDEISAPRATIGNTTAVMHAQVDPVGLPTTVTFQYGTSSCAEGGCVSLAPQPVGAPGSFGDQPVSASASGLAEGTTYHFRVVANNSGGESALEGTFTTNGAFTLADNRGWELVSPPTASAAGIEALPKEGGVIQAASDGSALTYISAAPTENNTEGNRNPTFTQNLATRVAGSEGPEWRSKDIAIPTGHPTGVLKPGDQEYMFFSSDLARSLVQPILASPLAEPPLSLQEIEEAKKAGKAPEKTLYVRNSSECQPAPSACFTPVLTLANVMSGKPFGGVPGPGTGTRFDGATPDLRHVVVRAEQPLTTESAAPGANLYEWTGSEEPAKQLRLVNVLPEGGPAEAAALGYRNFIVRHALSDTGSRVIFEGVAPGKPGTHLYSRDTTAGVTTQLDIPEAGFEPIGNAAPHFQTASTDGSVVFFTDEQRLTKSGTASESKADLYAYSFSTKKVEDLTIVPGFATSGESAVVQGVVPGASEVPGEDGTTVYFVANGVLTETPNGLGEKAVPGKCGAGTPAATCNVYVEHFANGSWEAPRFIAVLSEEDFPDWQAVNQNLGEVTSRVSPNGRFLAFMSNRSLTGYDNRETNPAAQNARDEEVFIYDRLAGPTGHLTCASCDPSGQRPTGVFDREEETGEGLGLLVDRPEIWFKGGSGRWLSGNIPGWAIAEGNGEHALHQPRYLSNDGRLFFNSATPLVPQAGGVTRQQKLARGAAPITVGVENVYQYEPNGVGTCTSPPGCVSLMSSGTSTRESAFLDASESGNDMFFLTAAPLVRTDSNSSLDVYNAHVCSAESPCVTPPPEPPAPCASGAACRPGVASVPAYSPGATTGPSTGNVVTRHGVLPETVMKPKPPTRAQLLAKALHACKKLKQHKKRLACERAARRRYGSHKASHGPKKRGKR
jgi:hypothetical protein